MKLLSWVAAVIAMLPVAAGAQLIGSRVDGDRRLCVYYGSDRLPNDQLVARGVTVGAAQECPATAPYRDPNAPPAPNAMLLSEAEVDGRRLCTYAQAGTEWALPVPLTSRCAMTPALLAQQQAEQQAGRQ